MNSADFFDVFRRLGEKRTPFLDEKASFLTQHRERKLSGSGAMHMGTAAYTAPVRRKTLDVPQE